MFLIEEADIIKIEARKQSDIKIIKGIMKVHQALSIAGNNFIFIRNYSCFCKKLPVTDNCYDIKKTEHLYDKKVKKKDCDNNETAVKCDNGSVEQDQWVILNHDKKIYPGLVVEVDEESQEIEVKTLKCIGLNTFVWPNPEDKPWYTNEDIV